MAVDINMYGLKYEFSRTSTNGADILITIHKKWYEGEVIKRALGRAPIIKRENKDHIYGTSCELYLECKVDGEFAEMYTSDPYEYRVSVYKNDTLLWIGYVSPELYSEPDIAPPYDVQVIATDGLGELKNKDFEKRGVASLLSHFNYLIGAAMPFSIVSDLRYEDENGVEVAAKEILNIKVNLDHESGENCYDVLQHLLKSLNANITQLNGRYLIFRETDFITKASDAGVEAFDVNGDKMVLPIAMFGSMRSHQWWPVGQLSTVVEPAKNKVTLTAPDNYKNNVLDFASWSLINASYLEKEGAYSLPNKNSAITQSLDFGGQEVGYRLGLRVRARNVGVGQYGGTSDKAQNLGLKVEMEGRAFADYLGPNFWLIKSEGISSGSPLADYMWKSNEERTVEEELRNPSSADSAADAQNIDIVLPLFDDGTNTYGSYAYAKKIKVTIFNPAGEHGIYVYDVSLVKYEQIKGYQADVVIDNAAREAGSDVELTLSPGIYAPAAAEVFMTGLPLQQSGHDIITQWKVGDGQMREYLTAMSYDYSRAVALPKMKYAGILNVPGSEALLPLLFLRDGTYYFPKTYSYDLYADEITVELLSISAADVSLGSVVISQTSEAAGTMGGVTTGGTSGGGGAVSVPRDKEMSDTSDNAVENRVIKAYVDDLRDQLLDLWHIDENGNLVTDKQVLIKNNLIVENDTSSGGDGQDTPGSGLDEDEVLDIVKGYTYSKSEINKLIDDVNAGDVDLTNYYTKDEVDAKIPSLDGYAKEGYVDDAITALNVGQYAKASDLENLQGEVDNIESVLGLEGEIEGVIDTWNEVKAFLDGYSHSDDLATILSNMNADIATRALDSDLDKLEIRVKAEEDVTTTYASWWADLKKYIKVEGDNVKIGTNLIVEGDTSSGGSGQDTPASGTVTGIKVNGTTYEPIAGIVTIPDYPTSLTWSAISGKPSFATVATSGKYSDLSGLPTIPTVPTKVSAFTNDSGYITGITKSMVDSVLGSTTAGNANRFLMSTGSTSVWAAISDYALPLSGGTMTGSLNFNAGLSIKSANNIVLEMYSGVDTYLRGSSHIFLSTPSLIYLDASGTTHSLIHSGNIGSYAMKWMGYDGNRDLNTFSYDAGVFGSFYSPNAPSGLVSYAVLNLPYRRNAEKPDFMAQILIPNGDGADTNMYYRTSLADSWNPWRKVISTADDGYIYGLGGYIDIQYSDEINRYGGNLHLQHRGTVAGEGTGGNYTGHILMCANGGYVGIGTTDPQYKFHIYSASSAYTALMMIEKGGAYDARFEIVNTVDKFRFIQQSSGNAFISLNGNHSLIFETSNTARMGITGGGYVGIGTTDPQYELDVNGAINTNNHVFSKYGYRLTGGTSGLCGLFAEEFIGGNINPDLWLYTTTKANIYAPSGVNITGAVTMSSALSVGGNTTINGIITLPVNYQIQWGTTGYMIYGTTSRIQVDAPLIVSGNTEINGNLVVSGDTSSGSDIRFKDVIKNKTIKIADIAKAPLFTFKWNDRDDDSIHLGSSAQYWEKVCPWLVKGEDFKTLDYSTLGVAMGISLAKKAVNHEERIKELERKVKSLEEENRRLRYGN